MSTLARDFMLERTNDSAMRVAIRGTGTRDPAVNCPTCTGRRFGGSGVGVEALEGLEVWRFGGVRGARGVEFRVEDL